MSDMNIFQRMLAITKEMKMVGKNLQVGEGRFAYKAVGEADVLSAVRPLEEKYGVYSYPASRQVIHTSVLVNKKTGNEQMFVRVETVYRFVNVDKPEECIEITTYGDGVDPQDKACGKAMTYADKYALLKAYKIMTGDDPDQYASEPMDYSQGQGQYQPEPTQVSAPAFSPSPYWSMLMKHYGYSNTLTDDEKMEVKAEAIGYLTREFNIQSGSQITEDMAQKIAEFCKVG